MYWYTGLVGLLLIAAPYTLGYSNNVAALWSSLILGVIVVGVSLFQALLKDVNKWEYWVAGVCGLLAVIAPFTLGFSALATATWTTVILGVIVILLAGYEIFDDPFAACPCSVDCRRPLVACSARLLRCSVDGIHLQIQTTLRRGGAR